MQLFGPAHKLHVGHLHAYIPGRQKQNFIDPAISLLFIMINYPPTFAHY